MSATLKRRGEGPGGEIQLSFLFAQNCSLSPICLSGRDGGCLLWGEKGEGVCQPLRGPLGYCWVGNKTNPSPFVQVILPESWSLSSACLPRDAPELCSGTVARHPQDLGPVWIGPGGGRIHSSQGRAALQHSIQPPSIPAAIRPLPFTLLACRRVCVFGGG